MKFALCVALVGVLSIQSAPATQPPSGPKIPVLTPPDGVTQLGKGGHGYAGSRTRSYEFQLTAELSSAEAHYRLSTDRTPAEIAAHYSGQLIKAGWTPNFIPETKLSHARFSVGASSETAIGTLTVVALESSSVMVSCRLIRANAPWRDGSRAGGGGANATRGPTIAFGQLTGPLQFPVDVAKAETRASGGNREYEFVEIRLATPSAPAALMTHLQGQLPKVGWIVDWRLSDAVQELVLRRNQAGDVVELWQLTSFALTREVDALVARIR